MQAAAHSAAAIRFRSWDPLLHLNHAALLLEAGDPLAARRQLESVAARWPVDDPRFAWNAGVASLQLGDHMAAAHYFKLVVRIDPDNQEAADALHRIERGFTEPDDDQGRSTEMR
jgi:Tfp pilus assembly protein PilF